MNNSDHDKTTIQNAGLMGACFDGETIVHVEELNRYGAPFKDIEEIQVGDKVLSRCEITGEMAYKRVLKVFSHGCRQQYYLGRKYGPEDNRPKDQIEPICVTEEHPFWVKGKGWVAVRDLIAGDEFLTYDGRYVEFDSALKSGVHEVFNIEVEDFHTYFVGADGFWVHD